VSELLTGQGESVYAVAFFLGLGGVALWEGLAPRRRLTASLRARWTGNFAIYLVSNALLRVLFPGLAVGVSAFASERGWGLFNQLEAPFWPVVAATVLVIDLGRYVLHWALHAVPILWRVHGMHHSDPDYDLTTGLRFHPFETVLYFGGSFGLIALIGAPVAAVLASEAILAISGPFVHGNVRLPARADAVLRFVFVTPDMHRVHHSIDRRESFSNFSSVFSWWDRLFGTYVAQPAAGHLGMRIGLDGFQDPKHLKIGWMLAHPFLSGAGPARPSAVAASTPGPGRSLGR
jgi:sterol desaturase/sphingolipid hydroxylase (fatty acid hydroxylase superfamily)